MTEQEKVADNEEHAGDIRSKLITRLAVAAVLVALLLGMLAFFDYLSTAPDDSEGMVFTKPVPVVPKKQLIQPVTPVDNLPEPPVPEKTEAPVEKSPSPTVEANVPAVVEAKPDAVSENRQKSPSTVASQKTAVARSTAPVIQQGLPESEGAPAPESKPALQRAHVPVEPVATKPSVRVLEAKPASVAAPAVSRLFSGFLLQAGVFSSVQRAEELHARLTLSGVPSSLETRVQVGPFKTKQEAEAAQSKLKELGVETILVPPRGKN